MYICLELLQLIILEELELQKLKIYPKLTCFLGKIIVRFTVYIKQYKTIISNIYDIYRILLSDDQLELSQVKANHVVNIAVFDNDFNITILK